VDARVVGPLPADATSEEAKDAADEFSVADLATDIFGLLVKLVNYVVDLVREVLTKNDQSSAPRN